MQLDVLGGIAGWFGAQAAGPEVGIVGIIVAGFLVIRQMNIMIVQTVLMKQQNAIELEQLDIIHTQNKIVNRASDMTVFSKPNFVHTGVAIPIEFISLYVHNFGDKPCREFRLLIGFPDAYQFEHLPQVPGDVPWTILDPKGFAGALHGYSFAQKIFQVTAYKDETVQLASFQLHPVRELREADVPLLFSIAFEDGQHPGVPFQYHKMPYEANRAETLPIVSDARF